MKKWSQQLKETFKSLSLSREDRAIVKHIFELDVGRDEKIKAFKDVIERTNNPVGVMNVEVGAGLKLHEWATQWMWNQQADQHEWGWALWKLSGDPQWIREHVHMMAQKLLEIQVNQEGQHENTSSDLKTPAPIVKKMLEEMDQYGQVHGELGPHWSAVAVMLRFFEPQTYKVLDEKIWSRYQEELDRAKVFISIKDQGVDMEYPFAYPSPHRKEEHKVEAREPLLQRISKMF